MRNLSKVAAFSAMLLVASVLRAQDSSMALADRIINSDKPVLVDFWAAWCAPCRMLAPIIKELEREYSGRLTVMKIDVDVHRQIASYFKVGSIPAVFILKDRKVVAYLPGLRTKEQYRVAVEEVLSAAAHPDAASPKTTGGSHGGGGVGTSP